MLEAHLRLRIAMQPLLLAQEDKLLIREANVAVALLESAVQAHPQHPPEAETHS